MTKLQFTAHYPWSAWFLLCSVILQNDWACAGEWSFARISSFLRAFFFLSLMMGKITFWTSIWMQFPENISRAKVLLQLFFWLWFYSSLAVCLFCLFFQLKSTLFTLTTLWKSVEFHLFFLFSVYLSILMRSFNFNYICFYWLSPIFFSVLSSDQIVV